MPNTEFERAESRIPHNFEAERAVIGCLIQDNSLVEEVFATISAEMFSSTKETMFNIMGLEYNSGQKGPFWNVILL